MYQYKLVEIQQKSMWKGRMKLEDLESKIPNTQIKDGNLTASFQVKPRARLVLAKMYLYSCSKKINNSKGIYWLIQPNRLVVF
jgi:hypothetical protein